MELPFCPGDFPTLEKTRNDLLKDVRAQKKQRVKTLGERRRQLHRDLPDIVFTLEYCSLKCCDSLHFYFKGVANVMHQYAIVGWFQKNYPDEIVHGEGEDVVEHVDKVRALELEILEYRYKLAESRTKLYEHFQESEQFKLALTQEREVSQRLELRLTYSAKENRVLTKQMFEMAADIRCKKECITNGQRLLAKYIPKKPCTICFDENNMANVILPCIYHRFCQICVERMANVNPCCPECRTPFSIDEVHRVAPLEPLIRGLS